MRKVFQVLINDKPYWVWDIEGKEHPYDNGASVKTWWVYYDDLPEEVIPPADSDSWHPFTDNNWFPRHCWEINIKQTTHTKNKWDETRFSNSTHVEMKCNGKVFYRFGTSGGDDGLHFAWNKAMYMKTMLAEHPFNFRNPIEENGRKIWFHNLPAIVKVGEYDGWEITIAPDFQEYMESLKLPSIEKAKEAWMAEYINRRTKIGKKPDPSSNFDEVHQMYEDEFTADLANGRLKHGSAFEDGNIDWFRK